MIYLKKTKEIFTVSYRNATFTKARGFMSYMDRFDLKSSDGSLYRFTLGSSNGIEFKPMVTRLDWVPCSSNANHAELATRFLFENPNTRAGGTYRTGKVFNEIFVVLLNNAQLNPMKLESKVHSEAINCLLRLKNNSVNFKEIGNDLYVSLKL